MNKIVKLQFITILLIGCNPTDPTNSNSSSSTTPNTTTPATETSVGTSLNIPTTSGEISTNETLVTSEFTTSQSTTSFTSSGLTTSDSTLSSGSSEFITSTTLEETETQFPQTDSTNSQTTDQPDDKLIVFVSSTTYNGNFSSSSPDKECQNLADHANLAGNFRAWISFNEKNAFENVFSVESTLFRVDGQIFSPSFDDLINGNIVNPLIINELGSAIITDVWTGTNPNGTLTNFNNCLDWTNELDSPVFFGKNNLINGEWTMTGPKAECKDFKAIYCFEVI